MQQLSPSWARRLGLAPADPATALGSDLGLRKPKVATRANFEGVRSNFRLPWMSALGSATFVTAQKVRLSGHRPARRLGTRVSR